MSLPVFISEIFVSWSTSYFQDRKPITYKRKYDNLLIDLCLSNVSKHDIDKITTQLLQRGFSVGSIFSYKEDFQSISSKDVIIKNNHEDTYAMTLVLTIELMNKLAVQNGIEMKQIHEYTSSQRAYFVQKSIDIIQRAGIKCDISLVHNQNELERIVSQLSVSELTSYYGHSTGVYLSWVKYTLLWLQVPSIVGIILFIFQFLSGFQLYFSFTPLLCIFTCVASLFYDKGLQQHLSLSIFSWGHISPFQYLPKSPLSSEIKVLFIPPLILSLFSALSLVICYLIIVLLINFLEEALNLGILEPIISSLIPALIHPYLTKLSKWISKVEISISSSGTDTKKAPPHSNTSSNFEIFFTSFLQLLNRFFLPLWFLFRKKDVANLRLFLACLITYEQIFESFQSIKLAPSYIITTTTNSILSNKPQDLQKLIRKSFVTSQMSFFNVPNKKKKKDKVKDAVKAFMNATPRLFSQDSQHSIYSIELPPSLDSENSKTKPKKMKWSMFDRLRGKSKQNDDSTPALSKSSSIPPGQDSPHGVIPQSPERFKWGKEKKIVKPRRDSSPIEMLEAHLNQDMPIPVEAANKNLGQYTDELSLSDSDSSSSEIEMLWGPESNDSSKEIEGGEVLNCILSELKSETFDLIDSYNSALLCYATVVLFNGLCPLLSFVIANRLQSRYSQAIRRLLLSRRVQLTELNPHHPHDPWCLLIQIVNICGILINCYQSFHILESGSYFLQVLSVPLEHRWILSLLISTILGQILLLAYWMIDKFIPGIPQLVSDGVNLQISKIEEIVTEAVVQHFRHISTSLSPQKSFLSKVYHEQLLNTLTQSSTIYREIEIIGKQKLNSLYASLGWSMRPAVFFLLSLLPFIVYVHTSSFYLASFFLGLTTLFCCYCHYIQLQRQRISCTLGIISDPDILELVAKSMPGWVISSEKNRVDWLNQLLQYSWPYMGAFAETKLSAKIKEIFQREKPELLTSMELTNVVAGTIPPKIISIKALHTGSSIPKTVEFEVEFVWLSDGYMVVEIGFLGQVFSIEICNLSFSGTVRVAMEPSTESHPEKPIKLMKATFMKNPKIDLNVSFGDLLPNSSINAKVIGLGPIISQTINRIIKRKFVFPNWMQKVLIPTDPSIRSSSHYVSPPIGILTVQILSCKNLIIGDITTSDPFVEVHYLDEIFTTSVKYKNLNPEWEDAYFDLILYDVNSLSLKLIVFDHDFTQEADYLGSLEIILNQENLLTLQQKTEQYSQKLVDGNDGSIQYRLSFKPVIVTSLDKNDTIQSDILFNFPENAFMSDILMSSASPSSSAPTLPILSSTNTSGRILNGIISVSNLKLELITTNQQSHTTTSTHHSSSNSFYISLYYHTHKKATGVVKGQCEGNNHQILKVSLEGAYSFVIFHQENSILHDDNNHKNNHPPLLTTTTSATSTAPPDSYHDNDHIVVKITHKNKFGSKSICEIYLSVQSLIKQKKNQQLIEKEFQKHIELGTNYTGIVKGNLSFYPLVEKWK